MESLAQLRQRLHAVRKACLEIGRIPPRPAGVRAAMGGIAVTVLQRLAFWYSPAVQRAIGGLTDVVDEALGEMEALEGRLQASFERKLQQERALAEARMAAQERALELERATTISLEGDLREQREAMRQLAEELRRNEQAR